MTVRTAGTPGGRASATSATASPHGTLKLEDSSVVLTAAAGADWRLPCGSAAIDDLWKFGKATGTANDRFNDR